MNEKQVIDKIYRKIDESGRLIIPMDLRQKMNLEKIDYIDMTLLEDGTIILKKHHTSIHYYKIIKDFLVHFKGLKYNDYYISKKDVEEFKETIRLFIEEKYH